MVLCFLRCVQCHHIWCFSCKNGTINYTLPDTRLYNILSSWPSSHSPILYSDADLFNCCICWWYTQVWSILWFPFTCNLCCGDTLLFNIYSVVDTVDKMMLQHSLAMYSFVENTVLDSTIQVLLYLVCWIILLQNILWFKLTIPTICYIIVHWYDKTLVYIKHWVPPTKKVMFI